MKNSLPKQITISNAEFLNPDELSPFQQTRWADQSSYIMANSDFYQRYFKGLKLSGDLAEIADLPFTDKEMLRTEQRTQPPFGSYLAADESRVVRMHRTSGTTGTAMNLALTHQDAQMTAVVGARAQSASGLGPQHRVVHCLNYQLWMGGYTDHAALEATGAMTIPFGVGNTKQLVALIRDLKINAISCTPSYPAVLEQVIRESFPSLEPRDLGLELGLFGGEAGLDDPAFRKRLEDTWGFKARNSNYGVTDVLCNFAGQTEVSNDLHFMAPDVLYPELIDPASGNLKPWQAGETGELVLTHLCKEAQPLVRFRTGDIITLTDTGKADCGRTVPRFRVVGRSDDMVVVRGINVFPTQVAAVITPISALSGEYRIVLNSKPPYDRLEIEVEQAHEHANPTSLVTEIEAAIKRHIGVTANVKLLAPNTFPKTEGKTKRVRKNFL
jgi:phenylacetate-CoA ligase